MIGYWTVSYESSDSQLEGPEEVEPIEPLVESETLGFVLRGHLLCTDIKIQISNLVIQ